MRHIYAVNPEVFTSSLQGHFPAYRAKQVLDWLYKKCISSPDHMTNLPVDLKEHLRTNFSWDMPEIDARMVSSDSTIKYRLKLSDESLIECVMIPEGKKRTLCVSSQAGCSRGCKFCATAALKLKRNLETSEIIAQVMIVSQELYPQRLTNLVFMGMGEPLDNLDNVLDALKILQDEQALSFSPRRTTISTCGVVPGIKKLAESGIKTKLAVSLNSAIEEKRQQIMPVSKQYPLNELKQALFYFRRKTNFRITFEYILIPEFNMSIADIKALGRFVDDLSSKINFIPMNPISGAEWRAPNPAEIDLFMQKAQGIRQAITLRKSRGKDILGACGQLVAQKGENHENSSTNRP